MTRPRTLLANAVALLLLCLATWIVYRPALNRVFAADQIGYMSELEGSESLRDGLAQYDYNVTRRLEKGDEAMFRPLLFVWLAINHTLFSYHHIYWNVAALVLHALTGFFLFRFGARLQPPLVALAAAVFFVVMKPLVELPLWNHLGGYILAGLFFMIGLGAFVRLTTKDDPPDRSAGWTYALAFSAAVFCHEVMIPISFVAGVLIVVCARMRGGRWRRSLLVAAAPLVVYAAPYVFHVMRAERIAFVDRHDGRGIFVVTSIAGETPKIVARWTKEIMAPSAITFEIEPYSRFLKTYRFRWRAPMHLFDLALSGAGLALLSLTLSRTRIRQNWPVLTLLGAAILAYAALVAAGRSQAEALSISYYLYLFCLMAVALIVSLADLKRLSGWKRAAAALVLGGFMLLHATETRAVAVNVGRSNEEASRFVDQVSAFVDEHRTEPGFTFMIRSPKKEIDPPFDMRIGYADRPTGIRKRRVSEILFMPYYDSNTPRYILEWTGNTIRVTPNPQVLTIER